MNYRPGQSVTFDIDGLQADVMRFMAIIAFCLIAILALVKNVETPVKVTEIEAMSEAISEPRGFVAHPAREPLPETPLLVTEPARAPIAIPELPARMTISKTETVVEEPQRVYSEPQRVYSEPPVSLQEQPQAVYEETSQSALEEQPQTVYEEQPQTVYEKTPQAVYEEQPQALALRFATDDAFVALISAAKIQLFARAGNEYYRMGASFGVTQAPAVGTLYDLLPASIPQKISRIFKRVVTVDGYLVALPVDMQNELNRYLQKMSAETQHSGTLVIHRNGKLSYER